MKYYIKLINNEKLEISFTNYIKYKNKISDNLEIITEKAILNIPYSSILFCYRKD